MIVYEAKSLIICGIVSSPSGGTQEITLTFAPDHESDYFSDGVHVELFNMEEAYSFQVIGQSKEHIMYVTGGQLMKPDVESLLPSVQVEPDEGMSSLIGLIKFIPCLI